jgi:hypothetical protein
MAAMTVEIPIVQRAARGGRFDSKSCQAIRASAETNSVETCERISLPAAAAS